MAGSRPQSHGDAISMENSLELSTTFLPTATTTNQQPQQHYINENQNCDDEDLDETNSKSHLSFPLLLQTLFSAINQCK